MSSHPSESVGSYWRRQKGIQFSSLNRKRAHCTVQTHIHPTCTSGKLSFSTHYYQFFCCTAEMQNSKFHQWRTPSFTKQKQHRESWRQKKPLTTLGNRLESDMADLVPGLLICLMAVQTIQHDGEFIILLFIFEILMYFVTGKGLFSKSELHTPVLTILVQL